MWVWDEPTQVPDMALVREGVHRYMKKKSAPLTCHWWFGWPGGKARIDADAGVRGKLASIMSHHVVRPLPGFEAWTSAFMAPGTRLETYRNNSAVIVAPRGSGGRIKLQGGDSSAEVIQADIYSCKVWQAVGWRCCRSAGMQAGPRSAVHAGQSHRVPPCTPCPPAHPL